jgi:hypothetical protein
MNAKLFMRTTRILLIVFVLFLFISPISGQDEDKKNERHHKLWEFLATLSSADRQKFNAARKQAMANPEVAAAAERRKQAELEYHKLLRREMLKRDPSLAPLLDQLSELRKLSP